MSPRPEPLRAVIADDEALARRRLRTLLAQEPDIDVVAETANGPETIDVVRAHAPDVLFLDVRMPGADGIEVLEALGPGRVGSWNSAPIGRSRGSVVTWACSVVLSCIPAPI